MVPAMEWVHGHWWKADRSMVLIHKSWEEILQGGKRLKFELSNGSMEEMILTMIIKEVMTIYTLPETAGSWPPRRKFHLPTKWGFSGVKELLVSGRVFCTRLWMTNISCRKTNAKLNASWLIWIRPKWRCCVWLWICFVGWFRRS